MELTSERLKEVLHYDPDTGLWTWLVNLNQNTNVVQVRNIITGTDDRGYIRIQIDGIRYKAHRLAWFYITGLWPASAIDHIDTNKSNNRWDNLRAASRSQNGANRPKNKRNRTGIKGVHQTNKTLVAQIMYQGKKIYLGTFDTKEEAATAYKKAAQHYFKEFAYDE